MPIWNERIHEKRIEKGITLAQIADRLGVTEATAQRYERGNIKSIPYEHMCAYGEILNCSPAYLMGWDEEDPNIQNRDADLEAIEKILSADGYALCCESYDDDYFYIKDSSGKTVAGLYDYELLPRYDYLKKKGTVTAKMLISTAFILYPEEKDHIKKYRNLDSHGKETVNIVLDRETARVKSLQEKENRIAELEASPAAIIEMPRQSFRSRHITEYFRDASAGSGIFILGNEAASKIAISDSDWDERVDFVIQVNGDSMTPDYMDGDNVMVSQRLELRHGDIGIFVVNGNAYIKEYGETELLSHNPKHPNIPIHEFDNIVCMGKVLGKLEGEYEIIGE